MNKSPQVNPVTGDRLVTKASSQAYREGYDMIFNKKEPKKQILLRNSGVCASCKDEIQSRSRHDFVRCKCGDSFVDGGLDYSRFGGCIINTSVYADEDDILKIREYFTWGSYGPKGDQPKHYILLKELSNGHINSILETQWHIKDSYVENIFKMELQYRRENALYKYEESNPLELL